MFQINLLYKVYFQINFPEFKKNTHIGFMSLPLHIEEREYVSICLITHLII